MPCVPSVLKRILTRAGSPVRQKAGLQSTARSLSPCELGRAEQARRADASGSNYTNNLPDITVAFNFNPS